MRIFGELWDAPVCEGADRAPTPVGTPCAWCKEPLVTGDSGVLIPYAGPEGLSELPEHRECFLRQIIGSPGHQVGRCTCTGWHEEKPVQTLREEALEAQRLWEAYGNG
jgi:hypothetical protein